MQTALNTQIKDRISEFVSELDVLVRKSTLAALQGILANGAAPAARRGRGPGRPKAAGRRSSANVEEAAATVLSHVQANDGQGISAIADATGIALPVAKKAAGQLIAAGALKKSGAKRGTVYHAGSGRKPRAKKAVKRRGRKAKKAKAA